MTDQPYARPSIVFACRCGEEYDSQSYAWQCNKCERHLTDDAYKTRDVVKYDTVEGKVLRTYTLRNYA